MKRMIACFLIIGCTSFAAARTENLQVVLEKTFLQPHCEPLLNMVAIDENELVSAADVLEVTQDNFNQVAESKLPVIIDVNASWCHSCQMISPIVDELSEKYKGKIQFAKIDIDSQNALAEQYGVTALPTIIFIKPGKKTPAMKSVGYMSKKDFEAKITEFMK